MREFQDISKINIEIEKQELKQQEHFGSHLLKRGHKIWEYNLKTGEINPAKYSKGKVDVSKPLQPIRHKLICMDDMYYVPALNKKNVTRKVKQKGLYVEYKP